LVGLPLSDGVGLVGAEVVRNGIGVTPPPSSVIATEMPAPPSMAAQARPLSRVSVANVIEPRVLAYRRTALQFSGAGRIVRATQAYTYPDNNRRAATRRLLHFRLFVIERIMFDLPLRSFGFRRASIKLLAKLAEHHIPGIIDPATVLHERDALTGIAMTLKLARRARQQLRQLLRRQEDRQILEPFSAIAKGDRPKAAFHSHLSSSVPLTSF
jgi:hypothetical protein